MQGKQVLVVEDDAIVAMWITDLLLESGAKVLGPAPNARLARRWLKGDADAVVVDVQISDQDVWQLVQELVGANVPIVLLVGSAADVPRGFEDVPTVSKITLGDALIPALQSFGSVAAPADPAHKKPRLPMWT